MIDECISPLRQRMIEDMTIRKFAPKTQHDYVQGSRTLRRSSATRPTRRTSRMCAATSCCKWPRPAPACRR